MPEINEADREAASNRVIGNDKFFSHVGRAVDALATATDLCEGAPGNWQGWRMKQLTACLKRLSGCLDGMETRFKVIGAELTDIASNTAAAESAKAGIVEHLRPLAEVVQKTWGVAEANGFTMAIEEIERMGVVESTPTPLTADAVKRMLPANIKGSPLDGMIGAEYKTNLGTTIGWHDYKDDFVLYIGSEATRDLSGSTVPAFAKLIESLGVTVEVGK